MEVEEDTQLAEKKVSGSGKSQRHIHSHRYESHKNVSKIHNTYTENLMQTHAGSLLSASVSMSLCEHCFVDSVDHILWVSSILFDPYIVLNFLIGNFHF